MKTQSKVISNLTDLYAAFGAESFWHLYRGIYKATPCGPWIRSIHCKTEAHTASKLVAIGRSSVRSPRVVYREEGIDDRDDITSDDLSLLGFDPRGNAKVGMRSLSLKGYREKVEAFAKKQSNQGLTVKVWDHNPHGDPIHDRSRIWVGISRNVPASYEMTGYDAKEEEHAGACGIEIGSIVEGSDAEVGPVALMFPFTEEEFDAAIQDINSEACSEWHAANEPEFEMLA